MFKNQKVTVVMPAYNAAMTLEKTYAEVIEQDFVDDIILVDDGSHDETVAIAHKLPQIKIHTHERNMGYGANQKTCYRAALSGGANIIIMIRPDYQYTPKLIPAMVSMIGNGLYHCVLGSRILGGHAMKDGMPWWKYISNRGLTFLENLLLAEKLLEYHTVYRAFSRELLEKLPHEKNSDDFLFDNQILDQILWLNYTIAEVSCPTKYFPDASSINFLRSVQYGLGCLKTAIHFRLARMSMVDHNFFEKT